MIKKNDCPMEGTKYKDACAIVESKPQGVPCPYASECRQILHDITQQKEERNEHDSSN